jgi:hypothetical protein
VKVSAGPWREGCEPLRVTSIACESALEASKEAARPEAALAWFAEAHAEASRESDMTITASRFIDVLSIQL